jgi:hypothetical protein
LCWESRVHSFDRTNCATSSGQDGEEEQESDLSDVDGEQEEGVESGKRASVVAVFRDGKGIEHKFQRT